MKKNGDNMNSNWIKLYSDFLNWEWYTDNNTKALFIHCLLKANWKTGNFQGQEILRGSFVTSLAHLSKETGLTIQQTRTALEHLISTGEITSKITNKYRIITITKYDMYQDITSKITSNQQATNNQSNKQLTTIVDNSMLIVSYLERIYARAIIPSEYEKIEILVKNYDLELIKYAIDISAENNAKKISYVEGILRNWKNAGYKTKQEVLEKEKMLKEKKEKEPEELFEYDWLNEEE